MKNLIVIFALLASDILNSVAQPNGGFENWTTTSGYQTPDNWQTLNFLSVLSNPISAFKATGVDKHSGNYALKLKTIFVANNPAPVTINDTIGYVFTGKVIISPPSLKIGIPYVGRPSKLEFWAKYLPVGEDVAGIYVSVHKWNGTGTDTLAIGNVKIDSAYTYTFFQIDLNYLSTEISDTLVIAFSSSYKKSLARIGSTLYIDDVALTGWVGIEEQNKYADKMKIFPNPAKDNITIATEMEGADHVNIINVEGKIIGSYKIQNYSLNINTSYYAEGTYLCEIRDKKNKILYKNKFNIVK
jgi:hypothetical protein